MSIARVCWERLVLLERLMQLAVYEPKTAPLRLAAMGVAVHAQSPVVRAQTSVTHKLIHNQMWVTKIGLSREWLRGDLRVYKSRGLPNPLANSKFLSIENTLSEGV